MKHITHLRKSFRNHCLLVVLMAAICSPAALQAQHTTDPVQLFKQLVLTYGKSDYLSMDYSVSIFTADGHLENSFTGYVKRSPDAYLTSSSMQISLVNKDYMLMVDQRNKMIHLGNRGEVMERNPAREVAILDSSLLQNAHNISLVEENATSMIIEMKAADDPYVDKIHFSIDIQSMTLTKAVYYYANNASVPYSKAEILYTNIRVNEEIPSSQFSVNRFVSITRGGLQPSSGYANYRIIDQRIKK